MHRNRNYNKMPQEGKSAGFPPSEIYKYFLRKGTKENRASALERRECMIGMKQGACVVKNRMKLSNS